MGDDAGAVTGDDEEGGCGGAGSGSNSRGGGEAGVCGVCEVVLAEDVVGCTVDMQD